MRGKHGFLTQQLESRRGKGVAFPPTMFGVEQTPPIPVTYLHALPATRGTQ
jgi:hypothetical protein